MSVRKHNNFKGPFIPCAGVIILDSDNTILVKTHLGNYSFPKGKRHKGETYWETGLREMKEETGVNPDNLEFLDGVYIDELSNKGNPNIRYFVANIKKNVNTFSFDSDELCDVKWFSEHKLLKLDSLKKSRKEIFLKAIEANQDPVQFIEKYKLEKE